MVQHAHKTVVQATDVRLENVKDGVARETALAKQYRPCVAQTVSLIVICVNWQRLDAKRQCISLQNTMEPVSVSSVQAVMHACMYGSVWSTTKIKAHYKNLAACTTSHL